jgi:hypothetical protein
MPYYTPKMAITREEMPKGLYNEGSVISIGSLVSVYRGVPISSLRWRRVILVIVFFASRTYNNPPPISRILISITVDMGQYFFGISVEITYYGSLSSPSAKTADLL